MPPAPDRTDIYDKLGGCLKLPAGKLAGLADVQRKQELKKRSRARRTVVQRSPRAASRKMQTGQTTPGARDFREGLQERVSHRSALDFAARCRLGLSYPEEASSIPVIGIVVE